MTAGAATTVPAAPAAPTAATLSSHAPATRTHWLFNKRVLAGQPSEPKWLTSPASPDLQAKGGVAPLRDQPAARVNGTRPLGHTGEQTQKDWGLRSENAPAKWGS